MTMRFVVLAIFALGCDRASAPEPSRTAASGATQPASLTAPACAPCGAPEKRGALDSPDIIEASGLAASAVHPGVYFVHNDSGDTPRFFAVDASGKELARYDVDGAFAIDWEDMAGGPCPEGRCLYFGDVGDNDAERPSYALYRVAEPPEIVAGEHHLAGTALPFRYPDGSHNCETVLVHPQTGEIVLVTKVSSGTSGVYRFPQPLTPGKTAVLEKVGAVTPPSGIARITGGSVHPKGSAVLLRSYTSLFRYPLASDIAAALAGAPCALPVALEKQGEAVAWTAAGDGYVTVSEGGGAALNFVACP